MLWKPSRFSSTFIKYLLFPYINLVFSYINLVFSHINLCFHITLSSTFFETWKREYICQNIFDVFKKFYDKLKFFSQVQNFFGEYRPWCNARCNLESRRETTCGTQTFWVTLYRAMVVD
jgi:hypothetical protein